MPRLWASHTPIANSPRRPRSQHDRRSGSQPASEWGGRGLPHPPPHACWLAAASVRNSSSSSYRRFRPNRDDRQMRSAIAAGVLVAVVTAGVLAALQASEPRSSRVPEIELASAPNSRTPEGDDVRRRARHDDRVTDRRPGIRKPGQRAENAGRGERPERGSSGSQAESSGSLGAGSGSSGAGSGSAAPSSGEDEGADVAPAPAPVPAGGGSAGTGDDDSGGDDDGGDD
jgi:hypothetical protein